MAFAVHSDPTTVKGMANSGLAVCFVISCTGQGAASAPQITQDTPVSQAVWVSTQEKEMGVGGWVSDLEICLRGEFALQHAFWLTMCLLKPWAATVFPAAACWHRSTQKEKEGEWAMLSRAGSGRTNASLLALRTEGGFSHFFCFVFKKVFSGTSIWIWLLY